MRKVIVNGDEYEVAPGRLVDVAPGDLLYGKGSRRAFRVVQVDGCDAILRNLRHPNILEAQPVDSIGDYYQRMAPVNVR